MVEVNGTSTLDGRPAGDSAVAVSTNEGGRILLRPAVSAAETWLGSVDGECKVAAVPYCSV